MARIIKRGSLPKDQVAVNTCRNCKSVVEYSKSDMKSLPRNETCVECPVCSVYIDWEDLEWKDKDPQ